MTPARIVAAALAALAIAAPAASAVTPPDDPPAKAVVVHTQDLRSPDARDAALGARQDLRSPDARDAVLRSPGAPSAHPGVPASDPIPVSSGSSVDWTAIVLAAGLGLFAICLVALFATRRRTPRPVV